MLGCKADREGDMDSSVGKDSLADRGMGMVDMGCWGEVGCDRSCFVGDRSVVDRSGVDRSVGSGVDRSCFVGDRSVGFGDFEAADFERSMLLEPPYVLPTRLPQSLAPQRLCGGTNGSIDGCSPLDRSIGMMKMLKGMDRLVLGIVPFSSF
jgi:hypothetical protein